MQRNAGALIRRSSDGRTDFKARALEVAAIIIKDMPLQAGDF